MKAPGVVFTTFYFLHNLPMGPKRSLSLPSRPAWRNVTLQLIAFFVSYIENKCSEYSPKPLNISIYQLRHPGPSLYNIMHLILVKLSHLQLYSQHFIFFTSYKWALKSIVFVLVKPSTLYGPSPCKILHLILVKLRHLQLCSQHFFFFVPYQWAPKSQCCLSLASLPPRCKVTFKHYWFLQYVTKKISVVNTVLSFCKSLHLIEQHALDTNAGKQLF